MSEVQRANLKVGCISLALVLYAVVIHCDTGKAAPLAMAFWGGLFLLWAVEAETARRWP